MSNKYHNIPTEYKGRIYQSKKEAEYAQILDLLKLAVDPRRRVVKWTPQVKYKFNCGASMIVDFLIEYADGHVEVHDVKALGKKRRGKKRFTTKTGTYMLKKKLLKDEYDLDIKEVWHE